MKIGRAVCGWDSAEIEEGRRISKCVRCELLLPMLPASVSRSVRLRVVRFDATSLCKNG